MSIKIQHKRSGDKDKAPAAGALTPGELAINYNVDSPAAYIKDSAGNIVKLAGAGSASTPDASETVKGIAEIATTAEVVAGTDDLKFVTPAKLVAGIPAATEAKAGKAEIATQAEVTAGTDDTTIVTPLKLAVAMSGTSSSGTPPATPANGDTWVDTSGASPLMKVWNATTSKWETVGVAGSGTPPTAPSTGTVWVDTSNVPSVIKVWDGTSWVNQAGVTITDPAAPAAPVTGQTWVDTSASPSVIKVWDGTNWVTTAPTGAASQALANDAKYATKAEVQAEDLWDRTGTEIHPKTAGDDVFTSGDVKVGGTTGAPRITLKADGSGTFLNTVTTPGVFSPSAGGRLLLSTHSSYIDVATAGGVRQRFDNDGDIHFGGAMSPLPSGGDTPNITFSATGNVLIGGTLPASPNISLKADGNIRAVGLAAAGRVYADNTAAKAGGLVDGDFYRKADGTLMVAYT